jgi:hypothetical protein
MVYPVPDPELPFLGVHVTRHIDGHVMLGPTAMLVRARDAYNPWSLPPQDMFSMLSWPGTWIVAKNFWRTGISELRMASSRKAFVRACSQYVPVIESMKIDPARDSGVRHRRQGATGDCSTTSRSRRRPAQRTSGMPLPRQPCHHWCSPGTRRPLRGGCDLKFEAARNVSSASAATASDSSGLLPATCRASSHAQEGRRRG